MCEGDAQSGMIAVLDWGSRLEGSAQHQTYTSQVVLCRLHKCGTSVNCCKTRQNLLCSVWHTAHSL